MAHRDSREYDHDYFVRHCGDREYARTDHWLGHFEGVARHIVEAARPVAALDVGCAMGMLVEALRDLGVDAYGLDVSEPALSQAREDVKPFLWQRSAAEPLPRSYDVITCIEVLEHLEPGEAESALSNLCAHTDDIIFSSNPLDYREATHLNVRPAEYWAEQFARRGFYRDHDFDARPVTPWAGRFRRHHQSVPTVIKGYERRWWELQHENVEVREALREARRTADHAQAKADDAIAAHTALLQTRTFRYTEPARRAYELLRKQRSRS